MSCLPLSASLAKSQIFRSPSLAVIRLQISEVGWSAFQLRRFHLRSNDEVALATMFIGFANLAHEMVDTFSSIPRTYRPIETLASILMYGCALTRDIVLGDFTVTVPKYILSIICLAKSRKTSGRCVAGKLVDGPNKGHWIRPVSGRPSGELSEDDRRFENGEFPALFDVINVPMKAVSPHAYQIENHLIDDSFHWAKTGQVAWADILPLVDQIEGPLWENWSSSTSGVNDRVDEPRAANVVKAFGGSLCLIHVTNLTISVSVEGAAFQNAKRKVRGEFQYSGHNYRVAITDPKIENQYFAGKDGDYAVGEALLCMSLGDAYNGYAYKLIAAVFLPPAA